MSWEVNGLSAGQLISLPDGDYIICEAQHRSRGQKVSDTLDGLTQPPTPHQKVKNCRGHPWLQI